MDGLFHGKLDDDWGYPYDLGNLPMVPLWYLFENGSSTFFLRFFCDVGEK